ncbi:MAG: O-antigen ligase family protein [Pseudobdellovibrionaceae bacterium]
MRKLRIDQNLLAVVLMAWVFIVPLIYCRYLNQNFTSTKAIAVHFVGVLAAIALLIRGQVSLPNRQLMGLAGLAILLKSITAFLFVNWVTVSNLLEGLSFVVLCLFFTTALKNKSFNSRTLFWFYLPSSLMITIYALVQFVQSRILDRNPEPFFFSGTFGNINMMAEYLVLLLPLGFYLARTQKDWKGQVLAVANAGWIFMLLVGQSRSAWIGLFFCFLFSAISKLNRREWLCYLIPLGLFFATKMIPYDGPDYAQAKSGSFSKRSELYKGASKMLLDNPLGIGGGRFPFSYIPYQMTTQEPPTEKERFDTPHSELLKWGIENGWAFLFVSCLWWLCLGFFVWKIKAPPELLTFYRTSYVVIGPQLLFQFPFENPGSVLALSFVLGFLFSASSNLSLNSKWMTRVVAGLAAALLCAKGVSFTTAKYLESQHPNNLEALETGCQIDRTNWYICFLYSMKVASSTFPRDAFPILDIQIRQRPFDYQSLRALTYTYVQTGNTRGACESALVYNTFFQGRSLFTDFIKQYCQSTPNPVSFQNSQQFTDDYKNWLRRHIKIDEDDHF